jgi:type IV secretion system protein VirD4
MLQRGAPKPGKGGKPMKDKHGKVIYEPYRIKVLNTINFKKSMHYNPFAYIHSEKDILKLVTTLIANTKGEGKAGDDFWVKAETLLYCALIGYIHYEAPVEEQNFSTLIEFINAMEVREDDEEFKNPVDLMFDALEAEKPNHFAVRQYKKYKLAAGKTAKSILVSVGVRLAAFNLPSIAKLTMTDELHLQELGERKIALFCCIPDSDKSLNYLVGMIYTQLIQTLYRQADRIHKGRLPVPVHCLMDEYANISFPKDTFLSALATMRSRAIFCSIIVQNMAQLKAMYKDDWESLVGLCDEFLYLGGTEKETHKYVSELLGKETISTTSYNQSKGRSGSYSINHQQSGRDVP